MALALKSVFFRAQTLSHRNPSLISPSIVRLKSSTVMASLEVAQTRSISQTFSKLKEQGKVALIPFITAGDPDLATTSKALKILDTCGSDLIELGMPYSDPLADGPVIQAAATRALAKGANFDSVISMLRENWKRRRFTGVHGRRSCHPLRDW